MKYLIIRFGSLGDCILLRYLVAHLKAMGAEEIRVLTKSRFMEIFACMPGVDGVMGLGEKAGLRTLIRMARSVGNDESVLIDAHGSIRSRFFAFFSGKRGPRIKKYQREKLALLLAKKRTHLPTMKERYLQLAGELGFTPLPSDELPEIRLQPPDSIEKKTRKLLWEGADPIAMAPGAKWNTKCWPVEKYRELAERLTRNYQRKIIILGDEKDTALGAFVAQRIGNNAIDLTGKTSITQTASILRHSLALICNDSGLLHLSEAVGTPVLAIFGPTVKEFGYYPHLKASKVCERKIPCRPCSRNGSRKCPLRTKECLEKIDVQTVEEIFGDLVNRKGDRVYTLS